MKERVILHVDMDGFYASVESLSHPEVAGKPMAVAGDPENRRGIILAKNQLAKKAGVRTSEPIWQAMRKCPGLILLPPHHELYAEYCEKANAIYERFTDRVERAGIDESYLDLTDAPTVGGGGGATGPGALGGARATAGAGSGAISGSGAAIGAAAVATGGGAVAGAGAAAADAIRAAVRAELRLTVSVGVSFCKIFAKMGSDLNKPDGTSVITRENYMELLYPLPASAIMSVGRVTEKALAGIGVYTVGQLAAIGEPALAALLGKHGTLLHRYACGLDDEPVLRSEEQEDIKSVGNGMTFRRDLVSRDDIGAGLRALSETVARRLRKHGKKCYGVQVSIKNPALKVIDRQLQLKAPTNLAKTIYESAMSLVERSWKIGSPIRLLAVTAISLTGESDGGQMSLFDDAGETARREALERSVDALRQRYGKSVVKPASMLKNDLGIDE